MERAVQRLGRTGFAAVTSLVWALPLAVWAGSVDLYPGPAPWAAFALGLVLLAGWLGLLRWVMRVPVEPRPHRFEVGAMSRAERLWNTLLAVCAIGIIGWLNAAATVDWGILGRALAGGGTAPVVFTVGIVAMLMVLVAGAGLAWRMGGRAYRQRLPDALTLDPAYNVDCN